jgi:hypothetical protein
VFFQFLESTEHFWVQCVLFVLMHFVTALDIDLVHRWVIRFMIVSSGWFDEEGVIRYHV